MKNRIHGTLIVKLEDGSIERIDIKTKANKGQKGFYAKLGDVITQIIEDHEKHKSIKIAPLSETPLSYEGDFQDELNGAIKYYQKLIEARTTAVIVESTFNPWGVKK